jgi:adhesin HecA-like repeat protein
MSLLRRALLLMAVVALGLALLGVFSVVAGAQGPCTDEFTGAVSDAWANASNWTAGVPTASTVACWSGMTVVVSTGSQTADTVEATNGGGLTVTGGSLDVPGGQSPVGDLTLSGGSLSGPFLDTGAFTWSGGTLEAAVVQTGGGPSSISGTASATLIGELSTTSPLMITNPNVVAALPSSGEAGLATSGTMTFGPGVTIASGNANPQYGAANIASNGGPTYGFAGPYQLVLTGGGTTTVAAGTTLNPGSGGSISLEANSLTSGETLDVDGTLDGDVSAPYPYEGQLIEGSGVINGEVSVTGEASVDPGDPLGTLTVNGNYTQSNGQIGFAIAGTTPGSGYSQLVATGPIAFIQAPASGEFYGSIADLGVEPENGFVPSIDDSFDVVHSPDGVTAVLGNAANPSNPDDTGSASAVYGILPGPDDVILKVGPD